MKGLPNSIICRPEKKKKKNNQGRPKLDSTSVRLAFKIYVTDRSSIPSLKGRYNPAE